MNENIKGLVDDTGSLSLTEESFAHLFDNAPKCKAGKSQIHGYGLIAAEAIAAGEPIVDFRNPDVYTEKPYSELERWRLQGGKYTGVSEERCIVSDRMTKYSLLNHSPTPNAALDIQNRQIVATRAIQPGEEVTTDYRLEPMSPEARSYVQEFL